MKSLTLFYKKLFHLSIYLIIFFQINEMKRLFFISQIPADKLTGYAAIASGMLHFPAQA